MKCTLDNKTTAHFFVMLAVISLFILILIQFIAFTSIYAQNSTSIIPARNGSMESSRLDVTLLWDKKNGQISHGACAGISYDTYSRMPILIPGIFFDGFRECMFADLARGIVYVPIRNGTPFIYPNETFNLYGREHNITGNGIALYTFK